MILLKCPACGTELVVGFSRPAEEMHCPECSASFIVGDSFVAIRDRRVVPDFGADYLTVGLYHYSHRSRAELDKSIQELDNVLRPHGVVYGLDGSRCYQIVVARAQAQMAARLLRRARFKLGKVELYAPYATWGRKAARWIKRLAERARQTQFLVSLWLFRRRAAHRRH
jgi:hypothetical protein